MNIVPIQASHWQQIEYIQHLAYGDDFSETIEVLKSKVTISPQTCFVCINEQQHVLGYLISHPHHKGSTPTLNQLSTAIESNHLHLHDLAIITSAQGQGLPKLLLSHLFTVLKNLDYQSVSLVSVQNSTAFWQKYNFITDNSLTTPINYGDNAICMSRYI
ncbi:GNAT family N-acetyltransferase [uncultured Photobacterium sp.]|uniref:GNAT family N-acetyltransferase n=1 Tax=uncultured Photobacterium sp. TaxID=173973 RepID=UPI00261CD0F2|nr:GNAT family N-acetyltransferase [uncultured Photobacterium sp.]